MNRRNFLKTSIAIGISGLITEKMIFSPSERTPVAHQLKGDYDGDTGGRIRRARGFRPDFKQWSNEQPYIKREVINIYIEGPKTVTRSLVKGFPLKDLEG